MQRSTLFQVEHQVLILLSVLSVAQIQVEQLWSSCQVGAHPLCQCSLKTEQMRLLYLEATGQKRHLLDREHRHRFSQIGSAAICTHR